MVELNGKLYTSNYNGGYLWSWTTGDTNWTQVISTYDDNNVYGLKLCVLNGEIYGIPNGYSTRCYSNLYKFNGTNAWIKVANQYLDVQYVTNPIVLNGEIYVADTQNSARGLFKWNGSNAFVAAASAPGTSLYFMKVVGNSIYAVGYYDGKLRKWTPGTSAFVDVTISYGGSYYCELVQFNGKLYCADYPGGELVEYTLPVITDVCGKTVTIGGDAKTSSTQSKFGGRSLAFNGTTDYLSVPDSDDFNFASGPFTIDTWVNYTSFGTKLIASQCDLGGDNFWRFFTIAGSPNVLRFDCAINGGTYTIGFSCPFTPTLGSWYHLAVVRVNSDNAASGWRLFVNGVSQTLTLDIGSWSSSIADIAAVVYLGCYSSNGPAAFLNGYIDEFRISKGIARWMTNFDVPTTPYTNLLNMSLVSNSQIAQTAPTSARIILFEEDIDSLTLNTELKAYISRNGGTTFTQATLEDEGNYVTGARVVSGVVDISGQPSGTNIVYKVESANTKNFKLHGTGVSWK